MIAFLKLSVVVFSSLFAFQNEVVVVDHEFHLSRSIVNYDSDQEVLQITTNIFIDDLESALSQYGAENLQISTDSEKEIAEEYIFGYLLSNLIIKNDGKELPFEFIGKEPSDDLQAIWCYMEVKLDTQINDLDIENNILNDMFDDQKNMTTIQVDKKRIKDILFTIDHTTEHVSLKK